MPTGVSNTKAKSIIEIAVHHKMRSILNAVVDILLLLLSEASIVATLLFLLNLSFKPFFFIIK